ncbi:MAG: GDSL-type esterase/lipase family protein [Verrucomicrobiales bacterium]
MRIKLNENARRNALRSGGCELRFRCSQLPVKLQIQVEGVAAAGYGGGLAQILRGDNSETYVALSPGNNLLTISPQTLPLSVSSGANARFSAELIRVLMPTHADISSFDLDGKVEAPQSTDLPPSRLLIYGSSITQGSGSLSTGDSWTGRCAMLLGMDLINLGLGGGCHCEPEMADYLSSRKDFDTLILETGINMLGLEVDQVAERIPHLIRTVARHHSGKKIYCLGVFPCLDDLKNDFTGRADEIRRLVADTVSAINSPNLHYIASQSALNPATGLTTDLVHPSPAGMVSIAEFVAREVQKLG